jgi:hypothetical protein
MRIEWESGIASVPPLQSIWNNASAMVIAENILAGNMLSAGRKS